MVRELVEARERTQLSQLDLSSRSGITLDAIRKIERGVVLEPGFFTVADLAIALGLDLARLAEPVDR